MTAGQRAVQPIDDQHLIPILTNSRLQPNFVKSGVLRSNFARTEAGEKTEGLETGLSNKAWRQRLETRG